MSTRKVPYPKVYQFSPTVSVPKTSTWITLKAKVRSIANKKSARSFSHLKIFLKRRFSSWRFLFTRDIKSMIKFTIECLITFEVCWPSLLFVISSWLSPEIQHRYFSFQCSSTFRNAALVAFSKFKYCN